jgi:HPt (histidine-containing phosphotransfer) domain-containing protein
MTDGDAAMLQMMLDMLIAEIPEETEKMNTFAATQQWHDLFQVSHKMKTTLAFIGNEEMTELNKNIEHCTRNNSELATVPQMLERLTELSKIAVEELRVATK